MAGTKGQHPAAHLESPRGHRREHTLPDLSKMNFPGHMAWPVQPNCVRLDKPLLLAFDN